MRLQFSRDRAAEIDSMREMNRNVWLLFVCQALSNAASVSQIAMTALIGATLAPDKLLATLPLALQMLANMLSAIPASFVFARYGRRAGFLMGATGLFAGSLLSALSLWRFSFALFCAGSIGAGLSFGVAQQYRFAAQELVAFAQRPRAIALVMAGGVLAAILGPELVNRSKDLLDPYVFLGTYLCIAVLPLMIALLLGAAQLAPAALQTANPVPIRQILARSDFIVAVIAGLVAYGSMNLVMATTPLEMMLCGFSVNDSTNVIRLHAIAMYAPGFITGRLIQRFGVHQIILAGGLLTMAAAATAISGLAYAFFVGALVMLGLGWNFMFVGATALLGQAHDQAERVRAQAMNEVIVFGTVTFTSLLSGMMQHLVGWTALNLTVMPPVAIALGLVFWHRSLRARTVAA